MKSFGMSSIKRRLFLVFSFISIIPALIISLMMYRWGVENIMENSKYYASDLLEQVDANIQQLVSAAEDISMSLAIDNNLINNLQHEEYPLNQDLQNQVKRTVQSLVFGNRGMVADIHIEAQDTMVFGPASVLPRLRITGSPAEEAILARRGASYWVAPAQITEDSVEALVPELSGSRYFLCASALRNRERTGYIGFVGIYVYARSFQECISGIYEHVENANMLLLDNNNVLVLSTYARETPDLSPFLENLGGSKGEFTALLDGQETLVSYQRSESTGWQLISVIPVRSLTQNLRQGVVRIWGISACLLLLCILLSYVITSQIILLLNPLLNTMRRIEGGDLSIRVPKLPAGELEVIGRTFNTMLDRYEVLIRKTYEQENLINRSRLQSLRSQLSPHFMYNTLDSINWTLVENEQYEISGMLVKLGNLLRYSISEQSDFVPLRLEIDNIRSYLDLCVARFEDRLRYHISIDTGLNGLRVPRFLLQPLVENSIKHAVESRPSGGCIWIKGYRGGNTIFFEVLDDGPGFGEEVLRRFQEGQPFYGGREHVGLHNLQERIRLIYGMEYGLFLDNAAPDGGIVRIHLPPDLEEETL